MVQAVSGLGERVYLYDCTLRDGAQGRGVNFTLADKLAVTTALDEFGVDYIEGGFPGANPIDTAYFAAVPKLRRATLSAFGMTGRAGCRAIADTGLQAVLDSEAPATCLVGKAWDRQVKTVLGVSTDQNLRMVADSLALMVARGRETLFDAEHFFDGFKANPTYALDVARTAHASGCRWVVLCDTNGGTLPDEIERIVAEVARHVPGTHLGIHCHNDTDNAVANSLAAVRAGARQIQGTLNGIGERCGNANMVSVIPSLMLKMGYETGIGEAKLRRLTELSGMLDARIGRASNPSAPYVGAAAFAHKGGLHAAAMARDNTSYEHLAPAKVGNDREIVISDKAGKASVIARLAEHGVTVISDEQLARLIGELKRREALGYAYEDAAASFALLARKTVHDLAPAFRPRACRVAADHGWTDSGDSVTRSVATLVLDISGREVSAVGAGTCAITALRAAFEGAMAAHFPRIGGIAFTGHSVRVLPSSGTTGDMARVTVQTRGADGTIWSTTGVAADPATAAVAALYDACVYGLEVVATGAVAAPARSAA